MSNNDYTTISIKKNLAASLDEIARKERKRTGDAVTRGIIAQKMLGGGIKRYHLKQDKKRRKARNGVNSQKKEPRR